MRNVIRKIKENSFWNKLIKNVVSAFVGESGAAVLNVLTTFLMIRIIGDTNYGMFVLAQTYMTIVDGVVNFQSWQAVIKYGTEYIEKNDYVGLGSIIKVGAIVDGLTAVAGTLAAYVLANPVSYLMGWGRIETVCLLIFSVEIIFHFSGTSLGVLRMFNRFKWVATQKIIVAAIKLLIVVVFFLMGNASIYYIVIAYVCGDIAGHLILTLMSLYVIYKHEQLSLKMIIKSDFKTYFKKFWSFAFWTNLTSSLDLPVKMLDVFILSGISYEIVAVYKVYKQIGNILVQLSVPISQAIMPQFSELVAKGKTKDCYRVMMKLHKLTLVVMVPATIVITIISPWALDYFFGSLYAKYFYILSLYLLSRTFALSYTSIHQLFVSMGYVRRNFMYTAISNVVYVVLAIILTHQFGILGMVISLFCEYFLIITLKKTSIKKICKI